MKKSRLITLFAVTVLLLTLVAATAAFAGNDKAQRNFVANLSGDNEVPANDSNGTGQALVGISRDETSIRYKLAAFNLDGVTMAHIHCGPPGANGPVVVFLYGPNPDGVSPSGLLSSGTATDADVIPRESSDVCPGGVANLADVIAHMRAGNAYVNVHSFDFPPGEIRGQLQ